jgi:hypothetical protein
MMRRPCILALLLVAAILAGCGGSDQSTSEPEAVSDQGTTTQSPTVRPQADRHRDDENHSTAARTQPRGKTEEKPAKSAGGNDQGGKQKAPQSHASEEAEALQRLAQRLAQRASEPLSDEELKAIAERAAEQNAQPPKPGQSVADSIRELEEVVSGAR